MAPATKKYDFHVVHIPFYVSNITVYLEGYNSSPLIGLNCSFQFKTQPRGCSGKLIKKIYANCSF